LCVVPPVCPSAGWLRRAAEWHSLVNADKNLNSTTGSNSSRLVFVRSFLFLIFCMHRCHCSYGCVLYMAAQIASAMRHMEYVGLVHGDLATRNCLVGDRLTVKVSDLGTARSLHAADYCRLHAGGPSFPLRWMAWESVVLVSSVCLNWGVITFEFFNSYISPFTNFWKIFQRCKIGYFVVCIR